MADPTGTREELQATPDLNEMVTCLDSTIELYQRLLDLGKRKERCLVDSDLTTLETIIRAEQQLVAEAAKVEGKRVRLQDDLATALGCPSERLTVSQLLDAASEADGRRLLEAQEELVKILTKLGEQNELNDALIHQYLAYTDYVLKTLQGAPSQTYDPKGGQGGGAQPQIARVIDRKV
jgi:flagellar biosynthesis/type III secretory pathway chaperone